VRSYQRSRMYLPPSRLAGSLNTSRQSISTCPMGVGSFLVSSSTSSFKMGLRSRVRSKRISWVHSGVCPARKCAGVFLAVGPIRIVT
jgi:hypothetical protein